MYEKLIIHARNCVYRRKIMARTKKDINEDQIDYSIDKQDLSSFLTTVLNKQFSKTRGQVSYDVSGNSPIDPTTVKH